VANSVKTEDVDFYNPHDTLKRDEGIYLDAVERIAAEEVRAVREDREPDFDNMPAGTGTPLVTREELPARPLAVGVESFTTLPVATESPDPADEDQVKAAQKANEGVREQVNEARLDRIKTESEAAKAAADTRLASAKKAAATPNDVANATRKTAQARKTTTSKRTATKRTAKKATAKK